MMEIVKENGTQKTASGVTLLARYEKLLAAKRTAEQQLTNLDRQIGEVRSELQLALQSGTTNSAVSLTTNGIPVSTNGAHGIAFKRSTNGQAKTNGIGAATTAADAHAFAVRRLEEVDADPRVRRSLPEILAFLERQSDRRGTVPEIHAGTGLSSNAVRSRLGTAIKYKLVRRVGGGKFALI